MLSQIKIEIINFKKSIQTTKEKAKILGIESEMDILLSFLYPMFFLKRTIIILIVTLIGYNNLIVPLDILTGTGIDWYLAKNSISMKYIIITSLIIFLLTLYYVSFKISLFLTQSSFEEEWSRSKHPKNDEWYQKKSWYHKQWDRTTNIQMAEVLIKKFLPFLH